MNQDNGAPLMVAFCCAVEHSNTDWTNSNQLFILECPPGVSNEL